MEISPRVRSFRREGAVPQAPKEVAGKLVVVRARVIERFGQFVFVRFQEKASGIARDGQWFHEDDVTDMTKIAV
jgi:hypothetical protein